MTMSFNYKIVSFILILKFLFISLSSAAYSSEDFNAWLSSYKKFALKNGVSKETIDISFKNVKFLEQVIKYDRRQPEFYEDTITYVSKRANILRVEKAKKLFKKNETLFNKVEDSFSVEKEILLALWGIETNFGKHVGKMDIISSLATLSYDKRRRDFFSSQLLILLKLIDAKLIDPKTLYGSWAGAYGNFQFMPSTIKSYAIDYDKNGKIQLKLSIQDALASAANYINKMGWKKNDLCYIKIELNENIPNKYLNSSAKKIKNHAKIKKLKKYIKNYESYNLNENIVSAIIIPDKDIIPDSNTLQPAFLIFHNYELILKWNRSLRFALAVCTLKDLIKDEL